MGHGSGRPGPEHRVPRALPMRGSLLVRSFPNEGVHVPPTKMEYLVYSDRLTEQQTWWSPSWCSCMGIQPRGRPTERIMCCCYPDILFRHGRGLGAKLRLRGTTGVGSCANLHMADAAHNPASKPVQETRKTCDWCCGTCSTTEHRVRQVQEHLVRQTVHSSLIAEAVRSLAKETVGGFDV